VKKIDLSKYQVRTDLAIEAIEGVGVKDGIITKEVIKDDVKITCVDVLESGIKLINKKMGRYITIEFEDITDTSRKDTVKKIFSDELKALIEYLKINDNANCLIIGLGNDKSTPDALGPSVIDNVIVTKHLFDLGTVNPGYRSVSAISPGVMGQTGIETSEIIIGIVKEVKPDFIIIVDALASSSLSRINKTIQMTDTGIHPGSGVGNSRKEISKENINIPVIAIGVPTVVDAVTIVNDTLNSINKHFAITTKNINNPIFKLIPSNYIGKINTNDELNNEEKEKLMGMIGLLNEEDRKKLIYEVLSSIEYNLMVTPKEIDFLIEKLSDLISGAINKSLHRQITYM
jgi:spore protease